ncbi:MAG: SpoIIE family protein phosphatase [Clostridia bacterium]|nr:SpoIIE family protein phosphatase [Clostridia bacterium]
MIVMILRMTAMTLLYVLVTALLGRIYRGRRPGTSGAVAVGILYGLCSVLSTHFGVDYGSMMLNVRDIGPLAAGFFFHPLSGVISGLIGGIERYIAGTYWGVGSYTRIACGLSTCLAGFLSAFLSMRIFNWQKATPLNTFFAGAMMEIFHMHSIMVTHRNDIRMAFFVVKNCSVPMILFTAFGLAACSVCMQLITHEWQNPLRAGHREGVSVTAKFQHRLFAVMMAVFALNFLLSFLAHNNLAIQNAQITLSSAAQGLSSTYTRLRGSQMAMNARAEAEALTGARTISNAVRSRGGAANVTDGFLEDLRAINGMEAVQTLSGDGQVLFGAAVPGAKTALEAMDAAGILPADGATEATLKLSDSRIGIVIRLGDGLVRVLADASRSAVPVLQEIETAFSVYHIGETGTFDLITGDGRVLLGGHSGKTPSGELLERIGKKQAESTFTGAVFGEEALCRLDKLQSNLYLLTMLPSKEVYLNRDMLVYESAFEDILVFAVAYILISLLVQKLVTHNLTLVNRSLARITAGELNEAVQVSDSREFAMLSHHINLTVDALKDHIAEAQRRIEQELELARTIQASALPSNFSFPRGDFEIYALMDPAKEVGGDFYDFFFVDADRLALVIADVSGKGIPAALFMMRSKTAIRSLAEAGNSPSEIFRKVNSELCEGNDAEMFVTAWIGIIDLTSGVMRCANAGHEYPAILRRGGDYELLKDKHSLVLAAMEDLRTSEYEIRLEAGDKLFVYTDGVPESINPEKEQYGTDRMLGKLNGMQSRPMQEVLPAIRQDVEDFASGEMQFDDITMLGFAYNGQGNADKQTGGGDTAMKQLTLEAKLENIDKLMVFVDGTLEEMGCSMKAQMQIDVAVDEVFSNIAQYAYPQGGGDATLSIRAEGNQAVLTFTDSGIPYNPLSAEEPDVTLSADERPIGGLGIFLVRKTMDDVAYRYEDGCNVLTIRKTIA